MSELAGITELFLVRSESAVSTRRKKGVQVRTLLSLCALYVSNTTIATKINRNIIVAYWDLCLFKVSTHDK